MLIYASLLIFFIKTIITSLHLKSPSPVPKHHIHRQMVREAADVARTEERAVVFLPAVLFVIHQQKVCVENVCTAHLTDTASVCQPSIRNDKLVQTAPEVLVLVGATQTLPCKG